MKGQNIKTSFPNGCSGIYWGWSNRGKIEKARTRPRNIISSDKPEWTGRSKRGKSIHDVNIKHEVSMISYFTKSNRRWEGLSTDVNEWWLPWMKQGYSWSEQVSVLFCCNSVSDLWRQNIVLSRKLLGGEGSGVLIKVLYEEARRLILTFWYVNFDENVPLRCTSQENTK